MGRTSNIRRKSLERQVVKTCPNCDKQIPVACKTCTCGHKFASKNRANSTPCPKIEEDDSNNVKIRRTERTRRERPDFFNPLLLENPVKRPRKKSQIVSPPTPVKKEEPSLEEPQKKKRGRPKGAPNKNRSHLLDTNKLAKNDLFMDHEDKIENEEEEEEEIDMYADMTQERVKQFNFILDDLNRKFMGQGSQPR